MHVTNKGHGHFRLHITEVELIEVLCRAEITPHPRADQYLPFRIRFEKLLASGRKAATSVFDPKETSALGYSGQAHALTDALAFGKIGWIISPGALAVAADCKAWIEIKSCLCSSVRLIQQAKQR
jgi:hypothetical protein